MEIIPLSTYPPPPEGRTVPDAPPFEEVTGEEEAEQAQEEQPNETTQQVPQDEATGNNVDTFA
ncbi:MAG: hypothetical protein ACLFRY_09140 [Spirochaetia bacterium]